MKWTAKLKGTEWEKKKKKALPKYRKYKYKIYLKEDPNEEPMEYNNAKMIFVSKVVMLDFFAKIKKDYFKDEIEWSEI